MKTCQFAEQKVKKILIEGISMSEDTISSYIAALKKIFARRRRAGRSHWMPEGLIKNPSETFRKSPIFYLIFIGKSPVFCNKITEKVP